MAEDLTLLAGGHNMERVANDWQPPRLGRIFLRTMELTSKPPHSMANPWRRLGRVLTVFFCLAVLEACLAGGAMAACGDYVTVQGGQQAMREGHLPNNDIARSQGSQNSVPRCDGPHCQRQFPPPAAPRPYVGQISTDRACLTTAAQASDAAGAWIIYEALFPPRAGARREIEHPPRRS